MDDSGVLEGVGSDALEEMPELEYGLASPPGGFLRWPNISFPSEVWDNVLEAAIGSFEDDLFGQADRRAAFMEVDITWASRITSNPAMWSDIYVNNTTHSSMAEFYTCIVNSKSRKLRICLEVEDNIRWRQASDLPPRLISDFLEEVRPLISIAMNRTSSLKLCCVGLGALDLVLSMLSMVPDSDSRELQQLQIESYPPQHGVELRHNFNSGFFRQQPLSIYRCSWVFLPCPLASVTVLHFQHFIVDLGLTWKQLKNALESAAALQVLHLLCVECVADADSDYRMEDHPCTLHHLTKLDIIIAHPSAERIARALRLPMLRTLQCKATQGWWKQSLLDSMAFLGTVDAAVVCGVEDLYDVVQNLPQVQRLDVRSPARMQLLQRFDCAKVMQQPNCCSFLTDIFLAERLSLLEITSFLHRAALSLPRNLTLTVPWERTNEAGFIPYRFREIEGTVVCNAVSTVDLFYV
ncbi:hypothetical protein B0H16DRAFT_1710646 [Mycena metata]|uniref:F-box domain-containing protein n=1 Tax=Mycena metata TaxID=1033252 RepID=A0AAD7NYW0_9AGAR|nr:hypothetical protein B0H16DRAFT_1710646 [Mycena metata]